MRLDLLGLPRRLDLLGLPLRLHLRLNLLGLPLRLHLRLWLGLDLLGLNLLWLRLWSILAGIFVIITIRVSCRGDHRQGEQAG